MPKLLRYLNGDAIINRKADGNEMETRLWKPRTVCDKLMGIKHSGERNTYTVCCILLCNRTYISQSSPYDESRFREKPLMYRFQFTGRLLHLACRFLPLPLLVSLPPCWWLLFSLPFWFFLFFPLIEFWGSMGLHSWSSLAISTPLGTCSRLVSLNTVCQQLPNAYLQSGIPLSSRRTHPTPTQHLAVRTSGHDLLVFPSRPAPLGFLLSVDENWE